MNCPLCDTPHDKIEFQCGICQKKYCSIKCFLSEEENSEEEAQNNEVDDTNNSDTNQDTDEKSNQENTKPTKEAKEQNT